MVCCGKVSLGSQTLSFLNQSCTKNCVLDSLKRVTLLTVSLFAVFASGALAVFSAIALFSIPAAVLPQLFIFVASLLGLVCAIMVLWRAVSTTCCKATKEVLKQPVKEEQVQEELKKESPIADLEFCFRAIGDGVHQAFDDKHIRRPRSLSQ